MRTIDFSIFKGLFGMSLVLTAPVLLCSYTGLGAQEIQPTTEPKIFVHPHLLKPSDELLVNGPNSKPVTIKSNAKLIWVDLKPGYRFGHSTECLLISEKGTQVIKGSWWPILNDKNLFRDRVE